MKPDWTAIRAHYEATGEPLRAVAERFGVPERSLFRRAAAEKWQRSAAKNGSAGEDSAAKSGSKHGNTTGFAAKNGSNGADPAATFGSKNGSNETSAAKSGSTDDPLAAKSGSKNGSTESSAAKFGSNNSFLIPENINSWDRLTAARFYVEQLGWAIHHLYPPDKGTDKERGKKPWSKGWRDHRAADVSLEGLTEVLGPGTTNNVGAVVRAPFVHVDLDSKPDAGESVRLWLESQPDLAAVPRERTGGGAHLAFICRDLPEGVLDSKKAIACQVTEKVQAELYFDGTNIVLSPSIHKSGHHYCWEITGEIPSVSWQQLRKWFGFEIPESAKRGRPKKDAPWWAAFRGDLATLDAVALFRELGCLGECLDPDAGKWEVRCPWEHEHSAQPADIGSDAVVFSSEPPGFRCLHAHCAERSVRDVCEWAEAQQPGLVDKLCREQRVWEEGQTDRQGRPRVVLPGMLREDSQFAREAAEILVPKKVWFNKAERVVAVAVRRLTEKIESLVFWPMEPVEARTAIEDHLQTGVLRADKHTGESVFCPITMSRECAGGLLGAPQFRRALPRIVRILDLPLPIGRPDGQVVRPQFGYDPGFETYTDPAAPRLQRMCRDEALEWIRRAHVGFGFRDPQSLTHAIARLITPYCRGLMGWDARFPLWHFSGNRPRTGKDYLAGITQIVYEGRSLEDAPLERDSEETRKRLTAALMAGRRMMHFANCQGHIQDAAFIGAITSRAFGARNLGSTEAKSDLTLPNEIEFSLSANIGLTFRPDVEPRTRRISLEFHEENPNGRKFEQPDLHGWVCRHRAQVLSAVDSLVSLWIEAGAPASSSEFNSFPEWARVVGGILEFHQLGDPCLPHLDDGGLPADRQTQAMRALFALGFERHPDKWISKAEIYELIEAGADNDAFAWFGDLAEKGSKHRLGKDLRQFRDRELGGVVMIIDDHGEESQKHRFKFTTSRAKRLDALADLFIGKLGLPAPAAPEPAPVPPASAHLAHLAHLFPPCGSDSKKIREKKEKRENYYLEPQGGSANALNAPNAPGGFKLVADCAELPAIADVIRAARCVAVDLETYGPRKGDGLDPWKGDIRLLTLRVDGQPPWIIDLRATGYDLGPLKPALESAVVIAHNAKFDLLWLRVKCGLRATKVACTLTAARLLTAGTKPGNDLDKCLERYLGVAPAADHSLSDWGSMLLTEDQLAYAARDVAHLHMLEATLRGELEMEGLDVVDELEMRLLPVIVEMEAAGIAVDRERLSLLRNKAQQAAGEHAAKLRELLGNPKLNVASPKQLLEALARAGITLENTNEETLKAADDGTIIPALLSHRAAEKQAQQAASLLECIRADGRIHGRFDPTGTATGRFSSKDPNLQNIGRGELRSCFVAAPGHKLIVADYSQIELRAAAAIAGETKMIEAYKRGVDLHRQTAALLLGKSLDAVTKDERQMAKSANFALLYGQSAPGYQRYAASSYGVKLQLEEATHIRRQFFHTYGALRQWHGESHVKADKGAREVRTVLQRRRLIPETASEWERFTALVNTPVQGSCADGMKQAIVNLAAKLPPEARLISTVHDELIVEAPEPIAEEVRALTQSTMVEAMAALFPQVPIEVEANVCENWGEKA